VVRQSKGKVHPRTGHDGQSVSSGIALHKVMYKSDTPNTIVYKFYSRLHVWAVIASHHQTFYEL